MSLVAVDQLSKIYGTPSAPIQVLQDINFTIEEGEFVALMGPSGSGKSTLLSTLGVLNPPTTGKILIDDIDVYGLSSERQADFRNEYIGFVFQQYQLLPYLSALENVMLPLAIQALSNRRQQEMAQHVLEKVGLGSKASRLPSELSGGEQNRVAIARAIVNEPVLLLADEPTGSLDSKTAISILDLFSSLNREGLTILMVTHNAENLDWVSRTLAIRDGRIDDPFSEPSTEAIR